MILFRQLPAVAAAALLALSSGYALADEDATVKEVSVSAELEAASGANALSYYPEMEADLQQAVAERVPVEDDPNGYVIQIKLQQVTLNGDTVLPDSREFNTMQGVALISSPATDGPQKSVPINLIATSAESAVPEGFVAVNPSPDDFYRAMIVAFADLVAEKVPETMREEMSR